MRKRIINILPIVIIWPESISLIMKLSATDRQIIINSRSNQIIGFSIIAAKSTICYCMGAISCIERVIFIDRQTTWTGIIEQANIFIG